MEKSLDFYIFLEVVVNLLSKSPFGAKSKAV